MALQALLPNPDKEKKTSKTGNHANSPNGQQKHHDSIGTLLQTTLDNLISLCECDSWAHFRF